jgi:DNA-directed RNA polymerase subunit RPC12/RpoP
MTGRHRAEPQYRPEFAPGPNNRAPELTVSETDEDFECPHCRTPDPSIQQTVLVVAYRNASPRDGGYTFSDATSYDGGLEHVEYRCNHCLEEVRIATGHVESLPIR